MGQVLETLGLPRYTIRWNHRGVLNAALRRAGIADEHAVAVIRIIDKEDKIGPEGVRAELGGGRVDGESGAPIPGLGLPEAGRSTLSASSSSSRMRTTMPSWPRSRGSSRGLKDSEAALAEIDELRAHLVALGGARPG